MSDFNEIISRGLARWGIDFDGGALTRLKTFADFLLEKNKVMNLTTITKPEEVAAKHMLDSLFLLTLSDFGRKTIDVGCGAGFPGMPIKLLRPLCDITLLDSTAKRIAFIRQAAREAGVYPKLVCARAEEYANAPEARENFGLAVSRAVAPLNVLLELCLPYLENGGLFFAMKSHNDEAREEIEHAKSALDALNAKIIDSHIYTLPNIPGERQIIIIEKTAKIDTVYPRKYKKIKANPL